MQTHVIYLMPTGEAQERGVKRRMSSPGIAAAEGEQAAQAQQPPRKRHRLAAASRSASPDFLPEDTDEAQPAEQAHMLPASSPARQGSEQMTKVTLEPFLDDPSSAAVGSREQRDVEDGTALHAMGVHQQETAMLETQSSPAQAAEATAGLASPKQQQQQPPEPQLRESDTVADGPSAAATMEHLPALQAVVVTGPQENGDCSAAAHSSVIAEDPGQGADVLAGHQQAAADSLAHAPMAVNGEGREENEIMQEADQMDSPLRDEPPAILYPVHQHIGVEAQTPAAASSMDKDASDSMPGDEGVGAGILEADSTAVLPCKQTGVSVDGITTDTGPHQEPMPEVRASENGNSS